MLREELKEHCQKQLEHCEQWAKQNGEELQGNIYEEHKLILELLEQEGRRKRKFEEIVVEYPTPELCTYPEYRGKPYFSIKYEENGEHIVGFGTYKPEVLSRYIQEYFIAPTIYRQLPTVIDKESEE